MEAEFDIDLSVKDLYRFSIYHNYTTFQGVLSIFIAIAAFVAAVITRDQVDMTYTILYVVFGIVFIFYMPVTLWMSAKRQMAMSEQLKHTLHYRIDAEGVTVMQNEEQATLPWKQVYQIKVTKSNVLIYSTRINAYIMPKEQLEAGVCENIKEIAKNNLEKHQYNIRKGK